MRQHALVRALFIISVPLVACNTNTIDNLDPGQQSSTTEFVPGDEASAQRAEELGLRYFLDSDPALVAGVDAVWPKSVFIDGQGQAHTRLIQTVNDIPVFGAEAIVHLARDGSVMGLTDKFRRDISVDTKAVLADFQAIDLAVDASLGWERLSVEPRVDLQILPRGDKYRLTYRVQLADLESGHPSMPVVFIDAQTGEKVWSYDNLQTARNREVHNLNHSSSLPGPIARTEGQAATGEITVDTNYDRLGSTYDCYSALFGRDSFDNAGAKMISSVHYSTNYVNAFWNGTQMVYGDGDNVTASNLAHSMDVTAHELTHAVTERTSGLIYSGESGGLNEAMSDIFGNVCEWYRDGQPNPVNPDTTWLVGEDCWTPATPNDALRYMNDPARDGSSLDLWTSSAGNVDVHYSSGIANLAFHLLAAGGTHPRGKTSTVVSGIGILDAAQIFYRANTVKMTPSTSFADARVATEAAATDLFGAGSNQVTQVGNAWAAVGVLPPPDYQVIDTLTNQSGGSGVNTSYGPYDASTFTAIKFVISGGTGDADMYVRFGAAPTTTQYDCRPYTTGNNETCEFNPSSNGLYYVMLRGYTAYSGVTLTVNAAGGGGGPTTETSCTDGVDNDNDGATDCADSDCAADAACQGGNWVVKASDDFESGTGSYTVGGADAFRAQANANSGSFSMDIQDNSGAASSFSTTTGMNLSGYGQIRIQYSMYAVSMENGEDYFVEVSTNGGSTWQVVGNYKRGTDFNNNSRQSIDIQTSMALSSNVKVRFRCDASGNNDDVYIDDVVVSVR